MDYSFSLCALMFMFYVFQTLPRMSVTCKCLPVNRIHLHRPELTWVLRQTRTNMNLSSGGSFVSLGQTNHNINGTTNKRHFYHYSKPEPRHHPTSLLAFAMILLLHYFVAFEFTPNVLFIIVLLVCFCYCTLIVSHELLLFLVLGILVR